MASQSSPQDLDHSDATDDETGGQAHEHRPALSGMTIFVKTFRANLMLMATVVAAVLGLTLGATLLQTSRYTAAASVQIENHFQRILGNEVEADQLAGQGSDTERFLQTQLGLLESRALAERVAKRLSLHENTRFHEQMGFAAPTATTPKEAAQQVTLDLLRSNLKVKLPRNTRILTITFESGDPALSAQIANTFAEEFIQSSLEQRYESAAYARNFVAGQLQAARLKLEQSERRLNAYSREHGLVLPRDMAAKTGGNAGASVNTFTTASLLELSAASASAQANRIAAEARVRAWETSSAMADGETLRNTAVQSLFTRRAELAARLENELTRRLESHPEVQRLRAELSVTEQQLELAAQNMRSAAYADLKAATSSEKQLNA